jgi:hypothetical protein
MIIDIQRLWADNQVVFNEFIDWAQKPGFGHFTFHKTDGKLTHAEKEETIHAGRRNGTKG